MGYGLGAAIGAQIANPGKQVINIAGDGCFRMNMNEIATAVRQKLPLIEVIVNNHVLGMVRQWQDLFYEKRYSATVLDDGVDYVKLAEAMGATGYRATTRETFNEALKAALAAKTPVVIDCVIGCDDKVWPMVAPGGGHQYRIYRGGFSRSAVITCVYVLLQGAWRRQRRELP